MRIKTAIAILGYALFIGNYIDVKQCDSEISELLQQNKPVVQQNLDKSSSSLEKKIITQSQDQPAKRSFTLANHNNTLVDSAETYGNINETLVSELFNTLAERCRSDCLYYVNDKGDIYEVEGVGVIYTKEGECFGSFKGYKGWVLLGSDGEVKGFGNNTFDESGFNPENLIEYGVCENDE